MGYVNHPLLEAKIAHASGGPNRIVAGVAGQTIAVYAMFFVVDTAVEIVIQSGFLLGPQTDLTGGMAMTANGAIVLDYNERPWFECADGEDFIINMQPGASIAGRLYYTQSATDTISSNA